MFDDRRYLLIAVLLIVFVPGARAAHDDADDLADIASQDLRAGGDANKRYFLIGPRQAVEAPKKGFGLVLILPGGTGDADFHPFVKRIYKNALARDYLAAQPVAVKWTDGQNIVWPTEKNRVEGMKFSTEEFVEAVIQDVGKRHRLDRRRILTLSWSSSGPAAYALALRSKRAVTGSFVAMSVFKPNLLPALDGAKNHAFFLYHSPEDRVCPFRLAEQARDALQRHGAKVELQTYDDGHGWHGNIFADLQTGFRWLEKNCVEAAK